MYPLLSAIVHLRETLSEATTLSVFWSTFNLLRRCRHKFPAGRKGCMPDSDISIVKCELGDPADVRCPVK